MRRLNKIYSKMLERCYNKNSNRYYCYGGKGITVCDEWLNKEMYDNRSTKGWIAFRDWALSHGYKSGLTIDRIDNNKGYSSENCRWVTPIEQANNKSNNRYITYNGKTQSMADWCRELGLNYNRVNTRLNELGWTVEKAFEHKENTSISMVTYHGETKCLKDWCKKLNLKYETIWYRINKLHWSTEKAFETNGISNERILTYKGRSQSLTKWCEELNLKKSTVVMRLNKYHWTIERTFETK